MQRRPQLKLRHCAIATATARCSISIGSGHAPGLWPHDTAPREARTLGSSLDSDTVDGNAVAAISLQEDYLSMTPSTLSNTLFKVLASDWPDVSGDNFNMNSDLHFETHFNLNNDVHAHNL